MIRASPTGVRPAAGQVDLGDHLVDQHARRDRHGEAEQAAEHGQHDDQPHLAPDRWEAEAEQIRQPERVIGEGPIEHPGGGRDCRDRAVRVRAATVRRGIVQIVARRAKGPCAVTRGSGPRAGSSRRQAGPGAVRLRAVPPVLGERDLSDLNPDRPGRSASERASSAVPSDRCSSGRADLDSQLAADGPAGREQVHRRTASPGWIASVPSLATAASRSEKPPTSDARPRRRPGAPPSAGGPRGPGSGRSRRARPGGNPSAPPMGLPSGPWSAVSQAVTRQRLARGEPEVLGEREAACAAR